MKIEVKFDLENMRDIDNFSDMILTLLGKNQVAERAGEALTKVTIQTPEPSVPQKAEPIDIKVNTPEEAKEVVTLSLETLLARTRVVIKAGFSNEVAGLLRTFEAKNVSALKPEQYKAYNDELIKLENLKK